MLHLISSMIAILLLVCAAFSDIKRFIIPNWVSLGLLILLPFAWLSGYPLDPLGSAWCFILTSLITGALWRARIWGGGDFKLMSALSPWIGPHFMVLFILITAVGGGVLALLILMFRSRVLKSNYFSTQWKEKFAKHMPYGLAITCAGIFIIGKVSFTIL